MICLLGSSISAWYAAIRQEWSWHYTAQYSKDEFVASVQLQRFGDSTTVVIAGSCRRGFEATRRAYKHLLAKEISGMWNGSAQDVMIDNSKEWGFFRLPLFLLMPPAFPFVAQGQSKTVASTTVNSAKCHECGRDNCRASPEGDWSSQRGIDWPLAAWKHFPGWHCCAGVWAMLQTYVNRNMLGCPSVPGDTQRGGWQSSVTVVVL